MFKATLLIFPVLFLTGPAAALSLALPGKILGEGTRAETPGSYGLPTGPYDGTKVPVRRFEGALDQRAFRLDAPGATTLALMAPLRDQVQAAGYTLVFECEARDCGGFDFRFGTDVLPEPDMHVDLGDFRFLSAENDGSAVSILVSRTSSAAYVQITQVSPAPLAAPATESPVNLDAPRPPVAADPSLPATTDLIATLDATGSAVLEDLVFASGSASLTEGEYPSLAAVAAWLQANPDGSIALVGHTDASGSLAANVALSERRAQAVAEVLIRTHGADPARVAAKGVGYLAPRATNQTEAGRQKNRRVEVIVTSTR